MLLCFCSEWIDNAETGIDAKSSSADPGDHTDTTPIPSSGKKKKSPSAKQKGGKGSDKPIPPREAPEDRIKVKLDLQ